MVEYDGEMTYNATDGIYILNKKVSTPPGNQSTAQSDQLGSDIWYFNDGVNQPTAADKVGCDDEGENMAVFSLVPALWNRPCLAHGGG